MMEPPARGSGTASVERCIIRITKEVEPWLTGAVAESVGPTDCRGEHISKLTPHYQ